MSALSASDAPEDVIAVIRAGARGYVTKAISGPELIDAVAASDADVIAFDPDNTITLHGVTMASLDAGDFLFS